ncbi:MAG: YHYH protein [Bacteroidia bacterium]|nr:YHYH protein [Bacteroidia bacterium]
MTKGTYFFLSACIILSNLLHAQGPAVTSWVINTTGLTGYAGLPANVQQVQYSTNNVYISCSCIPGYSIGPWLGNPNIPANKNFVFKVTRLPVKNTSTLTAVGLGHVGVWTNGVSIDNAWDAQSYNNQGVWQRNALVYEGSGFDNCLGHPQQGGEYHHHVNPKCLYADSDSSHHSPVIGFMFDGFPVYGAYAYADTNGTGAIKRMKSSFRKRSITTRTTLPNGSAAASAGPDVNATYPIGNFLQDWEYIPGLGDLDEHNGRFCKTPAYPNGTYVYFVTIDENLKPVYPFVIGDTYYGTVQAGNTNGPNSGHNTITEPVTTYNPSTGISVLEPLELEIYPNPTNDYLFLYISPVASNNFIVTIIDALGKTVLEQNNVQPTISYALDVSALKKGIYFVRIKNEQYEKKEKIFIR